MIGVSSWANTVAGRLRTASNGEGFIGVARRAGVSTREADSALCSGLLSGLFLGKFCLAYETSPDWVVFGRGPRPLDEVRDVSYAMSALVGALLRSQRAPGADGVSGGTV